MFTKCHFSGNITVFSFAGVSAGFENYPSPIIYFKRGAKYLGGKGWPIRPRISESIKRYHFIEFLIINITKIIGWNDYFYSHSTP